MHGDCMAGRAVSNTGPILHLFEIGILKAFDIFLSVEIPREVEEELKKYAVRIPKRVKIVSLINEAKDRVKMFTNQYNLDLGEASAISLALQQKADYFLTDDLEAREAAKKYSLEVHGTVGLLLRAFREKMLTKQEALVKVQELKSKSSLFITQDLITQIISAIEEFSKKR